MINPDYEFVSEVAERTEGATKGEEPQDLPAGGPRSSGRGRKSAS